MVATSSLGDILVDAKGMTLYLFKNDTDGESTCYDSCATNWPPLLSEGQPQAGEGINSALLGTVARTDGSMQVVYNKMPLYYFAKDTAPGDTTGQEVGDVWYVVSPAGEAVESEGESKEGAASEAAVMVADTSLGKVLVGKNGLTLYMFTRDSNGESACYDQCATNWPPLIVTGTATAGEGIEVPLIGTTTRKDGSTQLTFNNMPLYYFAKDKAAGDVTGQGVGDVWFVVSPAGEIIKTMPEASATSETGGAAQTAQVGISGSRFSPNTLTVKKGTTVKWTNGGSSAHTVTADDGAFQSDTLEAGGSFSFTFNEVGTFPYYCEIHGGKGGQGMSGVITVTE
jgi:predicted lipoprotein with Yx(FWY)xxD motif/plastocyanin